MQKISTVLMGKKIRDEREKRGLTQDELGELVFMDSSSVCRMEKGKTILVSLWCGDKRERRWVLWSMLAVWVIALIYLMFIYRLPPGCGTLNLDVFHMFREAAGYKGNVATNQPFRQILFNVLLYVPLGAVLTALTGKIWVSIQVGIGLSIITEFLQYWLKLGMADVDDVISNTLSLLLSVFLYKGFSRVTRARE